MKKYNYDTDKFVVQNLKDMVDLFNEQEDRAWGRFILLKKNIRKLGLRQALLTGVVVGLTYETYKLQSKVLALTADNERRNGNED